MTPILLPLLLLAGASQARVISSSASASASSATSPTPTTTAEATASPRSTPPATALIESFPDPEFQSWCPSGTYCAGDGRASLLIMQTVQLAGIFPDSKTFSDKPTNLIGELEEFVNNHFTAEGTELVAVQINPSFNASATPFLETVEDPVVRAWIGEVIGYWSGLIRLVEFFSLSRSRRPITLLSAALSLIPLNHTVVVPGGRYREVIIEGLLHSGLAEYARDMLDNFMDQIQLYGFIPNGGRKYYLNRSQPPVFTQMLDLFVRFTNDTSILERALPLADAELQWWQTNRTFDVTSPYTNKTHQVGRYNVFLNTAPRPEGYVEDWETVNLSDPPLNETQAEDLYIQLASGAESGWDYSARWMKDYGKNLSDPLQGLRSLAIRELAPVDLNALLASDHYLLGSLYEEYASGNSTSTTMKRDNATSKADMHYQQGALLKDAILDLFWDPKKLAFYDFNTTSSSRSDFFSLAAFYPFWLGIIPEEVENDEQKLFQAFSGLNLMLEKYNGSVPCTLTESDLNWDFLSSFPAFSSALARPNFPSSVPILSWAPHQYILTKALARLPSNLTSTPYTTFRPSNSSSFDLVPAGQLGMEESALPVQTGVENGTVLLLGERPGDQSLTAEEGWRDVLLGEVVNRYLSAAFCSWYSTGGSIPGILAQLPEDELNMFEKFSSLDIDAAGGGGEYEVVTGFGWTNGVVICSSSLSLSLPLPSSISSRSDFCFYLSLSLKGAGATYGHLVKSPICPLIEVASTSETNSSKALYAGHRVGKGFL
ncbi:Six-hairpin glycosidase-like protein [Mrakia frigida]|uniref:Six-hairpin glycosidase-like protein n=1 Tax=Mrakia frigida TaxID=29902 RepID=UPI003FCC147E